jgi:hypothetical protein
MALFGVQAFSINLPSNQIFDECILNGSLFIFFGGCGFSFFLLRVISVSTGEIKGDRIAFVMLTALSPTEMIG